MSKTNNGKITERLVQEVLKAVGEQVDSFDWQRMYDATSARGVFMPQVGDFQFFMPKVHGVVEVKSTKHEYRLSKGAFSEGQRAKLARRMNAGGQVWVVVHHWTTDVWRVLPYHVVHQAFNGKGHSSIDLRQYPELESATEAVSTLLGMTLENLESEPES